MRYVLVLYGFTFFIQFLRVHGAYILKNNIYLIHFTLPIIQSLWWLYYRNSLILSDSKRKLLDVIYVLTIMGMLIGSIEVGFWNFNHYSFMLMRLFIVPLTLTSFLQMLQQPTKKSLWQSEYFWINLGNFFYFGQTFFLFAFRNYYSVVGGIAPPYSQELTISLGYIYYSILPYAFYLHYKQQKQLDYA